MWPSTIGRTCTNLTKKEAILTGWIGLTCYEQRNKKKFEILDFGAQLPSVLVENTPKSLSILTRK